MFGMTRIQVILLLLLQALSYALFSYPLGIAVGQILCKYLSDVMNDMIGVYISPW
jgi:ABC-type antimicrobial peptide transport system permease subunit